MIGWLIRKFVPDWQDTRKASTRLGVGKVCGMVGIFLNLLLFASKYIVGWLVQSVSIKADAINNLTDAASNVVSIVSFYLAEKPADKEHPYGHERTESIASLFVGIAIGFLAFETLKESITKIIHPEPVVFHWYMAAVLIFSILVKGFMYLYNRKYAKKYNSSLLMAAALDSRSDCLGTFAVLLSSCISPLIHFELDGYMGVVVSGIIFYSAYDLLRSVINSLMGEAPDAELAQKIEHMVLSSDYVLGTHDLMIHTYGPTANYATVHAEVNGHDDIMDVHEHIDRIERLVKENLGVDLTIHMDPILEDDPLTRSYLSKFKEAVKIVGHNRWTIHDFRVDAHPDRVDITFDLVVPYEEKRKEEQISRQILSYISTARKINLAITLEHPTLSYEKPELKENE